MLQRNVLQHPAALLGNGCNTNGANDMTLEAHYTTGKQPTLSFAITTNGRRDWLDTVPVAGKREARQVIAARGAVAWNF